MSTLDMNANDTNANTNANANTNDTVVMPVEPDPTTMNAVLPIAPVPASTPTPTLTPIVFEGQLYFDEKELKAYDPIFFHGCSKARTMIARKQMEPDDYIKHAAIDPITKTWKQTAPTYKRSKMLVAQSWAKCNVPRVRREYALLTQPPSMSKEQPHDAIDGNAHTSETICNNLMQSVGADGNNEDDKFAETDEDESGANDVEQPPLLKLEDHEKFKKSDGTVLEIEVLGRRTPNECYFKAKDISIAFQIPTLNNAIIHQYDRGFVRGVHYTCFIRPVSMTHTGQANKPNKTLFLTYKGVVKVLFASKTGCAETFQDWAVDTLFTAQLGTQVKKDEAAAKLLNTDMDAIKQVFRCNGSKTPCIYLFEIGKASDILPADTVVDYKMGNKEDYIVYKYGRTDDFVRRASEHEVYFKAEFGVDIKLACFSLIDPKFVSNAEVSVKHHFRRDHVDYVNQRGIQSRELIVLHKSELKFCKEQFTLIQKSYIGCYEEILAQQAVLERKLADAVAEMQTLVQKHKYELLEKDYRALQQDKTIELQSAKIELLEYKLQYNASNVVKSECSN